MSSSRGPSSPSDAARREDGTTALRGVRGVVFDTQRYAVHDGPGIRTLVFLKGCPLSCVWCQNPEGRGRGPEMLYYAGRCVRCGLCAEVCLRGAVTSSPAGTPVTDRTRCIGCGLCARRCPGEARKVAGKTAEAGELLREAERDTVFYRRSGGGVTLSGGEPLAQPEFAAAVLALCRESGIHTAMETCGYAEADAVEEVARHADLILYDLKHMDSGAHRKATGVRNERILENARLVSEMGKPLVIRFPLVPGINDSPENVAATADFAASLPGVMKIDILPYHRLGTGKYEAVGESYPLEGLCASNAASLGRALEIMRSYPVDCALEGFAEGVT